jgi:nucleotidyltransferase substrate binding protein (TIGR01987 family)
MEKDIRWKQRFQNFESAFLFLHESSEQESYSALEVSGLVQAFEFTFELGWKTLKDYLEANGVDVKYPRETIKEAFASGLITDGHTWIEMLDKRNEFSHTYNQVVAEKAKTLILEHYLAPLEQVYQTLKIKAEK